MSDKIINEVIALLKKNKEFPNYQAERRIDIFINYFVDRILKSYLKKETKFICPEFPLKKNDDNRSTNIDYLCKTNDEIIFVELKTDANSLKEKQANIYIKADWRKCKNKLDDIFNSTKPKYRAKYQNLISEIELLKFDQNPEIRTIYLSPLEHKSDLPFKNINCSKPILIEDLDINISKDEKDLWGFILALKLYVFEEYKK